MEPENNISKMSDTELFKTKDNILNAIAVHDRWVKNNPKYTEYVEGLKKLLKEIEIEEEMRKRVKSEQYQNNNDYGSDIGDESNQYIDDDDFDEPTWDYNDVSSQYIDDDDFDEPTWDYNDVSSQYIDDDDFDEPTWGSNDESKQYIDDDKFDDYGNEYTQTKVNITPRDIAQADIQRKIPRFPGLNLGNSMKSKTPHTQNPEHAKKGKTYVIADIHGMYGSYMEAIQSLNKEDTLYILGDVIDRGKNGIDILLDIMKRQSDRKNNPEITFLHGNHEMQFLQTLQAIKEYGLDEEQCASITLLPRYRDQLDLYRRKGDQRRARYYQEMCLQLERIYEDTVKEKNIPLETQKAMRTWANANGGTSTLRGYFETDPKTQDEIYDFLINRSYAMLPTNINGNNYLLVHAMPPEDPQLIDELKKGKRFKIGDFERLSDYRFILQNRERSGKSTYEQAKRKGFTTICGHEPQENAKILKDNKRGFIRIDTGCGHGDEFKTAHLPEAKLSLYCIDDGTVKYIPEMEDSLSKRHDTPDFGD